MNLELRKSASIQIDHHREGAFQRSSEMGGNGGDRISRCTGHSSLLPLSLDPASPFSVPLGTVPNDLCFAAAELRTESRSSPSLQPCYRQIQYLTKQCILCFSCILYYFHQLQTWTANVDMKGKYRFPPNQKKTTNVLVPEFLANSQPDGRYVA